MVSKVISGISAACGFIAFFVPVLTLPQKICFALAVAVFLVIVQYIKLHKAYVQLKKNLESITQNRDSLVEQYQSKATSLEKHEVFTERLTQIFIALLTQDSDQKLQRLYEIYISELDLLKERK